jgi:hypothetical protein
MASRELEIVVSAKDLATKSLTKVQKASQRMGKAIGDNIKAGAIVAIAALASLTFAMVKAIKAANEQEDAEKSLTVALGKRSQALLDQAAALQKVTIFGDEAIIKAQALIGAFVKDEEQIKAATKATLDLAAAKGMDLTAAADLVSKTLGSSTNAMSRYGIEVVGAVGSTERLESLTTNISKVFGGQATAQAQTFSGAVQQMKNAFGDLLEELGFLITKNTFVIGAIGIMRDAFASLASTVKDNRAGFISLVKDGVIKVVSSVGSAIEVIRFFHNGWLGLKLAANGAIAIILSGISDLFNGLKTLLVVWDKMFDGLVKLGAIDVNPLKAVDDVLKDLKISSGEVLTDTLAEIDEVNSKYNNWGGAIDGITTKLKNLSATQAETVATAPVVSAISGGTAATGLEAFERQEALEDPRIKFGQESEIVLITQRALANEQKLEQIRMFHAQELALLEERGFSAVEIAAASERQQRDEAQHTAQFRMDTAQAVAGALSNIAQNLNTALGGKSKKAFKVMQAAAIAQTAIDTSRAAMGAYSSLAGIPIVGPILGVAAAGAAIAAGAAQIQQIKSQSFGGGGSVSMSGGANPSRTGGGASAQGVPVRLEDQQQGARQDVNITIQTDTGIVPQESIDKIIEGINLAGTTRNVKVEGEAVAT